MREIEKRKRVKKRVLLILILVNLAFIWGNSLLPADASGAFSEMVKEWILRILPLRAISGEGGSHLVRKLAHWSEYMMLGIWVTWFRRENGNIHSGRSRGAGFLYWLSPVLLTGLLSALIDETIQLSVAGRSGQITDVWIDCFGFCTGVLIRCLVHGKRIFSS